METMLKDLASAVSESDDLESFVRPLLKMLEAITGLESTYLTEIDERKGVQSIVFVENTGEPFISEGLQVPWDDTLCKRAIDEQVFYTDEVGKRWPDSGAAKEIGIQTFLSHPVCLGDGSLFGTLCGASHEAVTVNKDARKLLMLFSELIARQIDRERLLKKLQSENTTYKHFALTDPLTGIPNRRASMIELSRALQNTKRSHGLLHVAFIDLDGFKQINDTYGHDGGDRFLIELALTLAKHLRGSDFVGRIGGDEFLAFGIDVPTHELTEKQIKEKEEHFKERISALTQGRFDIGENIIEYGGASIGMVTSRGQEQDIEEILNAADDAMYEEKQKRRAQG